MGDLPGVGNKVHKCCPSAFPWGLAFRVRLSIWSWDSPRGLAVSRSGWLWRQCVVSGPVAPIMGGPEVLASSMGDREGLWCWALCPVPDCADPDQCVFTRGPLAAEVSTAQWPPSEQAARMKPEAGALLPGFLLESCCLSRGQYAFP